MDHVDEKFHPRLGLYWSMLSFQAGAINAGGVLSCGRGVSHVTGLTTSFGTNAAAGNWGMAVGLMSVPMFFLLGAVSTSALKIKDRGTKTSFSLLKILGLISFLLFLVFLLGITGFFGSFNAPLVLSQHYLLLALLSYVCGMQNALFQGVAGGVIRSTHLTGTMTDLGSDIAHAFLFRSWSDEERLMFRCRAYSVLSFIFGGLFASYLFLSFSYWGFALPLLTSIWLLSRSLTPAR